jgi:hypothetical protein
VSYPPNPGPYAYPVGPPPRASNPVAQWLLIGGAAAATLGSFLPWISITFLGLTVTKSGVRGGDGWIAIALAVAIGVLAIIELTSPTTRIPGAVALVLSTALMGLAIYELIDTARRVANANRVARGFAHASIGFGLVLVFIGAGVALAGAIVAVKGRSQTTSIGWAAPPPPTGQTPQTWQPPGTYAPPPPAPPMPTAPPAPPPSTSWPPRQP